MLNKSAWHSRGGGTRQSASAALEIAADPSTKWPPPDYCLFLIIGTVSYDNCP